MRTLEQDELDLVSGGVEFETYSSSGPVDSILDALRSWVSNGSGPDAASRNASGTIRA